MANLIAPKGKQALLAGQINLTGTTVGVLLVGTGYTYSAAHEFVSDVVANELVGTGYVRKTLASKTILLGVFDAADVTWAAIDAGTAKGAWIYQDGASDAARRLIAYIDTATTTVFPVTFDGRDYVLAWANDASKIFAL